MSDNEWGDFQTPVELAHAVLRVLGGEWDRVLEPTCGVGNFLTAAAAAGIPERVGIEVQAAYCDQARSTGATIITASIFDTDLARDVPWTRSGSLLVVGNPPWITSSQLGSLGSANLPAKSNLRNLRGIDAMTGASNFDISEFIILKVAAELEAEQPTIAMLCKTQVARNVIEFAHRHSLRLDRASIRRIDAKKWFDASVDACLFTFRYGCTQDLEVPSYDGLSSEEPSQTLGFAGGRMVADVHAHRRSAFLDGSSPFEWRQGIKHDAATVMELNRDQSGKHTTRTGEVVEVEDDHLYPLLKCTDVFHGRTSTRSAIVTQRRLGDDTTELAKTAPALWQYLTQHRDRLDGRKSSIYRGRPPFSMFGIGDYTFAPWKVAVSGLHQDIRFRVVGPVGGKPVVFDDTCYMLPFERGADAAIAAALLSTPAVRDLLASLTFPGSKRTVTKKLLTRIDLRALAEVVEPDATMAVAGDLLGAPVTEPDWQVFVARFEARSAR
ncbi:MAG: hypothetical protein R2689_00055 [Microthrixaceae bacterium]